MKKIVVSFLVCISVMCYGQDKYSHAISGEIAGFGVGLSAQYDFLFSHSSKGFFDARVGVGGWLYTGSPNQTGVSIPHAITYNYGSGNRFLEFGLGANFMRLGAGYEGAEPRTSYNVGPMLGYRSISQKGFQFRVYVSYLADDHRSVPWIGVGFGKAFRKK